MHNSIPGDDVSKMPFLVLATKAYLGLSNLQDAFP